MSTTQKLINSNIGHLLPHPQILNFHDPQTLPTSLPPHIQNNTNLRLMMGAGDLNHGNVPNIQKFSSYDVFLCLPLVWDNALIENVQYLGTTNKLLCFLDINISEQVAAFTTLFTNAFAFIDGHGGHCPHFDMYSLQKLLKNGAQATNIFEHSESCIYYHEMLGWIQNGYLKNACSENILTGLILNMPPDAEPPLKVALIAKIHSMLKDTTQITLPQEVFMDMPNLSLRELQVIARVLCFDKLMPVNLKGTYEVLQRDWQDSPYPQFVVTKVNPDYMLSSIPQSHPEMPRIVAIIEAIDKDIANGLTFPSKAKYRTLRRRIAAIQL